MEKKLFVKDKKGNKREIIFSAETIEKDNDYDAWEKECEDLGLMDD